MQIFKVSIIWLVIFYFSPCNLHGQEAFLKYYSYIDSAEVKLIQNKYSEAILFFDSAFEVMPPLSYDIRNYLKALILESKYQKAIDVINNMLVIEPYDSLISGIKNLNSILNDSISCLAFNRMSSYYTSTKFTCGEYVDSIRKIGFYMVAQDQKFRAGSNKLFFDNLTKVKEIDKTNFNLLLSLIRDNGGWLCRDDFGIDFPVSIIVLHLEKEHQYVFDELLPYMIEAVQNGCLHRNEFCHIINYSKYKGLRINNLDVYNRLCK